MKRALAVVVAWVCVVGFAVRAEARRTTVTVKGQSVVAGGNQALARAQAINAALRNAIGEVAGTLGAPAEGDDGATDKAVYGRAAAFVPHSTVLNQDVDGNVLEVEVSVEVDVDALQVAIGGKRGAGQAKQHGAGAGLGGKRVLILATEQLGPHQIFGWTDHVWGWGYGSSKTTMMKVNDEMGSIEAMFADGFNVAGFHVIDANVLKGKLAPKPAFEVLDLSASAGRQIAEKSDADFVVIAKGVAQNAYHSDIAAGGMYSGQANVVARLIRVKDGKVMASATQHAAQIHIDEKTARLNALNEAARLAADELTKKLDY
jgi:hypothetical protein